jgi:probable HAF family extracellular repeat protein
MLGGDISYTNAVSADGSVIVGQAKNAAGDARAISWVDGSTTATDLGALGGDWNRVRRERQWQRHRGEGI